MTTSECAGPIEPRREYVRVGSTRLSYLTWGAAGAPLVMLHGITSSARTWWRVAPELVARGYRPYAFDLPGHGESDAVETHGIPDISALIAGACASLGLSEPAIVGHSWGGAVALLLALQISSGRVVLVDPLVENDQASGATRVKPFLVGVDQPRAETEPTVRANNPDWHNCDVFWKTEALEQCRPAAVRGVFESTGDWALFEQCAKLGDRALILVADPQYTILTPPRLAAVQAALARGGGAILDVPGTTHNMFRGAGYAPFMQALLSWL
jgi:pimeloyl-ACP methyl ester carboxylesterase